MAEIINIQNQLKEPLIFCGMLTIENLDEGVYMPKAKRGELYICYYEGIVDNGFLLINGDKVDTASTWVEMVCIKDTPAANVKNCNKVKDNWICLNNGISMSETKTIELSGVKDT